MFSAVNIVNITTLYCTLIKLTVHLLAKSTSPRNTDYNFTEGLHKTAVSLPTTLQAVAVRATKWYCRPDLPTWIVTVCTQLFECYIVRGLIQRKTIPKFQLLQVEQISDLYYVFIGIGTGAPSVSPAGWGGGLFSVSPLIVPWHESITTWYSPWAAGLC